MKKNREITLELKKVKIANLRKLKSINGGTGTNNNDDPNDPGTDKDSRKICSQGTKGDAPGVQTAVTCVNICPSVVVTIGC